MKIELKKKITNLSYDFKQTWKLNRKNEKLKIPRITYFFSIILRSSIYCQTIYETIYEKKSIVSLTPIYTNIEIHSSRSETNSIEGNTIEPHGGWPASNKKNHNFRSRVPLKIQRIDREGRRSSFEYRRYFDPRRISVIRVSRVSGVSRIERCSREGREEVEGTAKTWKRKRARVIRGTYRAVRRYRERVASKRGRETLFYPSFRATRGGVTCRVTSGSRSNRNGARSTDERKPRKRNSRVASNIFRASRVNAPRCLFAFWFQVEEGNYSRMRRSKLHVYGVCVSSFNFRFGWKLFITFVHNMRLHFNFRMENYSRYFFRCDVNQATYVTFVF